MLEVERAPIFDESPNIPHTFSALRSTDIYDLMMETVPPPGKKAFFLTLTFGNDARLLERLCNFHNESVDAVTPLVESDDWNFITFLQPFPAVLANASAKKVKVLGLDHILYLLFLAWQSPSDDALFHEIGYNLIGKPKAYSEEIGAGSDFVYMNYARREQNLLSGYGEENFQHLVAMVEKYDPIGVFQTQCPGGWKMSAA